MLLLFLTLLVSCWASPPACKSCTDCATCSERKTYGDYQLITVDVGCCNGGNPVSSVCCTCGNGQDCEIVYCNGEVCVNTATCNDATSVTLKVPLDATSVTIQVHHPYFIGDKKCKKPGDCCTKDTATYCPDCESKSGVCEMVIDLSSCPCNCDEDCAYLAGECATAQCSYGKCEVKYKTGHLCRASCGVCDAPEYCVAGCADCPEDEYVDRNTICRASAGACDIPEYCTGESPNCPYDAFKYGNVCRDAVGSCDKAEKCNGEGPCCPPDQYKGHETLCRQKSSRNACDTAEYCSGYSAYCPPDDCYKRGYTYKSGDTHYLCGISEDWIEIKGDHCYFDKKKCDMGKGKKFSSLPYPACANDPFDGSFNSYHRAHCDPKKGWQCLGQKSCEEGEVPNW